MKTPPRAQGTRKRTRIQQINETKILDAGLQVFSVFGYHGSTIDQIAAEADMTKPNLLYYFRRKEDIYTAVLTRTLGFWLKPLAALDPDGDPETEIKGYINRKIDIARQEPTTSRLFAMEVAQGVPFLGDVLLSGPLKTLLDDKAAVIARWSSEGRLAPVDPYHLIFMIWATTHFETAISNFLGGGNEEAHFEKARRTLEQVFLNGIRPAR